MDALDSQCLSNFIPFEGLKLEIIVFRLRLRSNKFNSIVPFGTFKPKFFRFLSGLSEECDDRHIFFVRVTV